jgi:hypothetical protein
VSSKLKIRAGIGGQDFDSALELSGLAARGESVLRHGGQWSERGQFWKVNVVFKKRLHCVVGRDIRYFITEIEEFRETVGIHSL